MSDQHGSVINSKQSKLAENKKYFSSPLAEFVYYRSYSRWNDQLERREVWPETVDRYMSFMQEKLGPQLTQDEYNQVRHFILYQKVMPSMRLLWSAGPAARVSNVAAYNCAYLAPQCIEDVVEIMYLLMCGVGVGFSVENQFVKNFSQVIEQTGILLETHKIADTKEGWCEALKAGFSAWINGFNLTFDFSALRPQGARLSIMGGFSSGPQALKDLLDYVRARILACQGDRLCSLDWHDMICKMGETVVMGGVRRSALISLSDFNDDKMRDSKKEFFYRSHPERAMANNSAVYLSRPPREQFWEEWCALKNSGTGERGIFNRGSVSLQIPKRRVSYFENEWNSCGTNPCGEIFLRSKQFCNLSEVVARPDDSIETLLDKIKIATLIGTYQATLTQFQYLSLDWKKNCEDERLLGVSITGIWDCALVRDPKTLQLLRQRATEINREYSKRFGINPATAMTCVKPSGSVSLLVDASAGMHPRFSKYFVRRIRIGASDPLFQVLKDQGFPYLPEAHHAGFVLEFPMRSPAESVLTNDLSAPEQLEHWKLIKTHYTEHNPSVTIYVGSQEWGEVFEWVYNNWDIVGGLSFLPRLQNAYQLAPYSEINEDEYERRLAVLPEIDYAKLMDVEDTDHTIGAQEFGCTGHFCEIDSIETNRHEDHEPY